MKQSIALSNTYSAVVSKTYVDAQIAEIEKIKEHFVFVANTGAFASASGVTRKAMDAISVPFGNAVDALDSLYGEGMLSAEDHIELRSEIGGVAFNATVEIENAVHASKEVK